MAASEIKECEVCNNEFDEYERCPRNLPCSHFLCSKCISHLIRRNNKYCPFCRLSFRAKSVHELGKNSHFFDLLKRMNDLEAKIASPVTSQSKLLEKLKKESESIANQNITSCQGAAKQIRDTIKRNDEIKRDIQHHHIKIKGEIMGKLNELEDNCNKEVQFLEEVNKGLRRKLDEVEEKEKEAQNIRKVLQGATTIAKVDSAFDEVEASNDALQSWLQNFRKLLTREAIIHEKIKKNTESAEGKINAILKFLNSAEWKDDFTGDTEAFKQTANIHEELSSVMLQNMSSHTKDLVRQNKVYAVQHIKGKRKIAKISIAENKLLVHYLEEGILPPNAGTIDHDEVMSLVDPSSILCFLEFGTKESILGRIFIRLRKDSKRSQNFAFLCTGQMGPSYVNTNIIKVCNKGGNLECINGGDYERNSGWGGKELVPGTLQESLKELWAAGTVYGGATASGASQYFIVTKNFPGQSLTKVFGRVECGLQVATTAVSQYTNINDVKVTDCGIVLPL